MSEFIFNTHGDNVKFSSLNGLDIVEVDGLSVGSDEVTFKTLCGRQFKMYHNQDCCEDVSIDDVCGDVGDIIGLVISAEERESEGDEGEYDETSTWTFYDIQTSKGSVNIKWLGSSNGYYSESVDFSEGVRVVND